MQTLQGDLEKTIVVLVLDIASEMMQNIKKIQYLSFVA